MGPGLRTARTTRIAIVTFVAVAVYALLAWLQQSALVHPLLVVLVIAGIDAVTGGSKFADRTVVATALYLGAVPLFGWVHLPAWVDPLAVVSTFWVCAAGLEVRNANWRHVVNSIEMIPAGLAAWFSFQWWRGIASGSTAAVLERLLPVWDFSSHFNFFLMNLTKGVYITRAPFAGPKYRWDGIEYPTGIHYVWSRFAYGDRAHIVAHTERAIPLFASTVVVTMAMTVAVMGICFLRMGENPYRRFAYSAIGAGMGVGLVVLGPLSQTVYAGFVNMTAVVIASALLLSLHARPVENTVTQTIALTASALALVYNWYPMVLVALPILTVHVFRLLRQQKWAVAASFGAIFLLGAVPPVFQTLALGINHLDLQGGIQPLPTGAFATIVFASLAVSVYSVQSSGWSRHFVTGVPPVVVVLGFGLWLRFNTGQYPYYFHKASLLTLPFAVMALILAVIDASETKNPGKHSGTREKTGFVIGSVLLAFSLSQVFGYWGVDYPTLAGGNSAIGVLSRNDMVKGSVTFLPTAQTILREADLARSLSIEERSCLTLIIPTQIGVISGANDDAWKNTLSNVWFHALTDSYNSWSKSQAYMTSHVGAALADGEELAGLISKTFDPPSVCILSSTGVTSRLRSLGPQWQTRDLAQS